MTFFLKPRTPEEQAEVDNIMLRPIPSIGERIQAQATETRILKNFNDRKQKTEADLIEEVIGQIPPEYITAKMPENSSGAAGRYDYVFDGVRKAQAANPDLKLPTSIEEFDAQVDMRRRAELDEARDVLDLADGFVPELIGDIGAELTNPESIPYLMMGAGAGWRLGATMAAEGVAAGIDEARTIGTQFQVAEDLDIEGPNVGMQVGVAALTGAGVAGALVGGGKALSYGIERFNTTGARRPANARQLDFAQDVEAAETALRTGTPVPEKKPADPLLTILPPEQSASVPMVRRILDFTGDLEAPKGYDQIYSGIRPQDYPPQPLTKMTIKQVLAWQDSIDPKYQSEASGRFQMMEDTLRPLYKKMGLTGDELFDEAMQDRLAVELMREKGLDDFLAGRMSARVFGQSLAKVWAGLPQLTGPGRGRSVYAGLAGNKSLTSANSFEAILGENGTYTPRARDEGTPYQGGTTRQYTRDGQITAGDDFRIDVAYEVVDLPTLTRASGDLQPRDRSRSSSDEQINEIAAGLDPARLMPSPEADRGAPIVGPDSIIESGNGRVMGIQRAYERFPDRADAYRAQIEAAGFAVPEGMTQPVLVARRTSDLSAEQRSTFVRQANVSSTARMSATERAAIDARAIDSETVAMFDPAQPLTAKGNVPFTQRFLNKLPQTERNALVSADGRLNAEGVTRVRQALFGRAFDAPDILARYAEADAGELRSLMDALEASAPAWAGMRNAISEGRVRADLDVTPFVLDAMRLIADARRIATRENKASAAMVEELMADVDLLEGATAPLTAALVRMFYPAGRAAPAAKVSAFLDRFAAEAQKVGRTDASLFDDAVSDLDVLKAIDADAFGQLTETGKARIPDSRAPQPRDVPSDAMPENAFADGAASSEVQEAADELAESLRAQDATDAQTIRDLVAEFEGGDGIEVKLDGETMTSRQILDDLDQDEALQTVIDACTVKGAA